MQVGHQPPLRSQWAPHGHSSIVGGDVASKTGKNGTADKAKVESWGLGRRD